MSPCQEKVPLSAPHKLLAHGTALVQRLDGAGLQSGRADHKRVLCFTSWQENLPSATGQTWGPWERGHWGSTSHRLCRQPVVRKPGEIWQVLI